MKYDPTYHKTPVDNLRAAYKERFGETLLVEDFLVWKCCEDFPDDESALDELRDMMDHPRVARLPGLMASIVDVVRNRHAFNNGGQELSLSADEIWALFINSLDGLDDAARQKHLDKVNS